MPATVVAGAVPGGFVLPSSGVRSLATAVARDPSVMQVLPSLATVSEPHGSSAQLAMPATSGNDTSRLPRHANSGPGSMELRDRELLPPGLSNSSKCRCGVEAEPVWPTLPRSVVSSTHMPSGGTYASERCA